MGSVFFTNSLLFFVGLIALFCTITAYFVPHKIVSAMVSICGAVLAIFCITYALLLGANLYEVLIFILVLAAFSALTFLPHNENENHKKRDEQESHDSSYADNFTHKAKLLSKDETAIQNYKKEVENELETTIISTIPQDSNSKREEEQ